MYFTEKEKSNMAVLFSEISNSKKNDFIFFYSDDLILSVKVENFFDSDNDEDFDSENYEEYNACVVQIKQILVDKNNKFKGIELFELNYRNFPREIKTEDGRIIYQNASQ